MHAPERHLAAILSADAVGYSRLMAEDEAGTIRQITACRDEIGGRVGLHRGRVVDAPGDNVLVEFRSALDAVRCAVEIQRALKERNAGLADARRMDFRIGVHLGDIAAEGGRLYGTGVNVAARLESLAAPGGICISAEVYGQVEGQLELGFDDLGEQSVKNIPKPVRAYRVRLDGAAPRRAAGRGWTRARIAAASAGGLALLGAAALWWSWPAPLGLVLDAAGLSAAPVNPPLPDKPSLVVLPFDNLSGDPEQEYFADGMVEDLTTDLSRNPRLFVIARNTAFTYKGKPVRIQEVGRELGVRYAVEGSVRRAGDTVRINVQLIDATNGLHVWSDRYDGDLADIFALQNQIATAVLDSVGVEIAANEIDRAARKTADLNAYDAYLKAQHHMASLSRRGTAEARRWLERAIELDPDYAEAHGGLAISFGANYFMAWDLDPALLERSEQHARRCIELAPALGECYSALANSEFVRGRAAEATRHAEKAVELAPNFFGAHLGLGLALMGEGKPLRAIESLRRALRLNPSGEATAGALAFANYRAGRVREAVEIWERVRTSFGDAIPARILLAHHYETAGDAGRARALVAEIRAVNPELVVAQLGDIPPVRALGAERVSAIQANLRSAGLPE